MIKPLAMRAGNEIVAILERLVASEGVRARRRKERLQDARSARMLIAACTDRDSLPWTEIAVLAVEAVETECRDAEGKSKTVPRKELSELIRTVVEEAPDGALKRFAWVVLRLAIACVKDASRKQTLGEDMWLVTRQILESDTYRTRIPESLALEILELCESQISQNPKLSFANAAKVLILLATPTNNRTLLASGGDRLSMLLSACSKILASDFTEVEAKSISVSILARLTAQHPFDVINDALEKTITEAFKQCGSLWSSRRHRPDLLNMMRYGLRIFEPEDDLMRIIRMHLDEDLETIGSRAHTLVELEPEFFEILSLCYSVESLEAKVKESLQSNVAVTLSWLYAASLSLERLELGNSVNNIDRASELAEAINHHALGFGKIVDKAIACLAINTLARVWQFPVRSEVAEAACTSLVHQLLQADPSSNLESSVIAALTAFHAPPRLFPRAVESGLLTAALFSLRPATSRAVDYLEVAIGERFRLDGELRESLVSWLLSGLENPECKPSKIAAIALSMASETTQKGAAHIHRIRGDINLDSLDIFISLYGQSRCPGPLEDRNHRGSLLFPAHELKPIRASRKSIPLPKHHHMNSRVVLIIESGLKRIIELTHEAEEREEKFYEQNSLRISSSRLPLCMKALEFTVEMLMLVKIPVLEDLAQVLFKRISAVEDWTQHEFATFLTDFSTVVEKLSAVTPLLSEETKASIGDSAKTIAENSQRTLARLERQLRSDMRRSTPSLHPPPSKRRRRREELSFESDSDSENRSRRPPTEGSKANLRGTQSLLAPRNADVADTDAFQGASSGSDRIHSYVEMLRLVNKLSALDISLAKKVDNRLKTALQLFNDPGLDDDDGHYLKAKSDIWYLLRASSQVKTAVNDAISTTRKLLSVKQKLGSDGLEYPLNFFLQVLWERSPQVDAPNNSTPERKNIAGVVSEIIKQESYSSLGVEARALLLQCFSCTALLNIVDKASQETLLGVFLSDREFVIRYLTARQVSNFGNVKILDLLRPKTGLDRLDSKSYLWSQIIVAGEVGRVSASNQIEATEWIIQHGEQWGASKFRVAEAVLEDVACSAGLRCRKQLFSKHLPSVIGSYCRRNRSLISFPIEAAGFNAEQRRQFFKEFSTELLAHALVFDCEGKSYANEIADICGSDYSVLLENNIQAVWRLWPLFFASYATNIHRFWKVLRGRVENLEKMSSESVDKILAALLLSISVRRDPEPPMYSPKAVSAALWKFAGDVSSDRAFRKLISDRSDRIANVLYQIWDAADDTKDTAGVRPLTTVVKAVSILCEQVDLGMFGSRLALHIAVVVLQKACRNGDEVANVIAKDCVSLLCTRYPHLAVMRAGIREFSWNERSSIASMVFSTSRGKSQARARLRSLVTLERSLARVGYILDRTTLQNFLQIDSKELSAIGTDLAAQVLGVVARTCSSDDTACRDNDVTRSIAQLGRLAPHAVVLKIGAHFANNKNELRKEFKLEDMQISLIETLSSMTTGRNAAASRASFRALLSIMSSTTGSRLVRGITNSLTREELEAFQATTKSVKSNARKRSVYSSGTSNLPDQKLTELIEPDWSDWASDLSCVLISHLHRELEVYSDTIEVCRSSGSFAINVLPYVCLVAARKNDNVSSQLRDMMTAIFAPGSTAPADVVKISFKVLAFAREWSFASREKYGDYLEYQLYTSSDSLTIAKAALRAGLYFEAIYYAEQQKRCDIERLCASGGGRKRSSFLLDDPLEDASEVIAEALCCVNEPDTIYGIPQSRVDRVVAAVQHEKEGDYLKALFEYESLLNKPTVEQAQLGTARSLKALGMSNLLGQFCEANKNSNMSLEAFQVQAAWEMGRWDAPVAEVDQDSFQMVLYNAMHAVAEADIETASNVLESGVLRATREFVDAISSESTILMQGPAEKLFILSSVKAVIGDPQLISEVLESPESAGLNSEVFFSALLRLSQLLQQPHAAVRSAVKLTERMRVPAAEAGLVRACDIIQRCCNLQNLAVIDDAELSLCQAKLTWEAGDRRSAAAKAYKIVQQLGGDPLTQRWSDVDSDSQQRLARVRSKACHYAAHWVSELRLDADEDISMLYLEMASAAFETTDDPEGASRCFFALADFADIKRKSLEQRMASPEFHQSQTLLRHKTAELEKCTAALEKYENAADSRELTRYMAALKKQIDTEQLNLAQFEDELSRWVGIAAKHFFLALRAGDFEEIRGAFRFVSLWFAYPNNMFFDQEFEQLVQESIPLGKLLPLAYQFISRLSLRQDSPLQIRIRTLVERLCVEHPHHCLWHLWALSNGARIPTSQKGASKFVADNDKVQAARLVLDRVRFFHGRLLDQMSKLGEGYIELAEMKIPSGQSQTKYPIKDSRLGKLEELDLVPLPTLPLPLHGFSKDVVAPHVTGFESKVETVGGINVPKLVFCNGSDGITRKQLVKGSDDLRQDAVMEQLFSIVNELLTVDGEAVKRALKTRTYRVVPLTPCAGVLQWVNDSMPVSQYLVGRTGKEPSSAHQRYRKQDWLSSDCRKKLQQAKDKEYVFDTICKNFRPVMQFFFVERFPQSSDWFEKRLTYTRSVAVSSVVGYIIGLGDRHGANILIDLKTAEVIHIDLGVAFEQGKLLRTPELVPFRLTRDIVDGMGVFETEGVFRRCCEIGLRVLRENRDLLLAVVEVFLHDPLFKWQLSPLKTLQRQRDDDLSQTQQRYVSDHDEETDTTNVNREAAKALLRVREKLLGYEGNEVVSVEAQVHGLISDATDKTRLSRMFEGWAPWV